GYGVIDGKPIKAPHLSMTIPFSAGGLLSTAGDRARWDIALSSGRVVSPEAYRLMTTATTLADGASTPYGFGLFVSEVDGHPNVMHRSEERRVGKECRARVAPYHEKKKKVKRTND